jgi:hypothetical protein
MNPKRITTTTIALTLLLSACGGSPVGMKSKDVASNPNSLIGQKDGQGFEITVDTPENPACQAKTVSVTMAVFETCLVNGMTYIQVSNIIGFAGEIMADSGTAKLYSWSGRGGSVITANFLSGKMFSKSQSGLQ